MEIEGRLDQSLYNAVWLTLGLERQDFRVRQPWGATLKQPNQQPQVLPSETRVMAVFEETQRQLLILGEPGSGKTTMLLELAQALLKLAQTDNQQPIPVLVNLSSWKDPKQSILDWLLGELKLKYGLRADLAKDYLKQNQLLPLLDGLDEVETGQQRACAMAINAWMMDDLEHKPCGLVVCCRREEFETVVREPLSLYGAIYLQALQPEQITAYFQQFGLVAVDEAVRQDLALQDLLTKPLFLSMFGLISVQGKFALETWQERSTSQEKVRYLFDTYWDAAMDRELIDDPILRKSGFLSKTYGKHAVPRRKAVRRALVFAAKALEQESVTELLIEKMQPRLLQTQKQKWMYRLIFGLIFGLSGGLIFGLIGSLGNIRPVEEISISMSCEARREIIKSLRSNLILGLNFGLIGSLIGGRIFVPIFGLIGSRIFVLIFVLIGGLKADIQTRIEPNQGIKGSVKNTIILSTIALTTALPFKLLLEHLLVTGQVDATIIPRIVGSSLSYWVQFPRRWRSGSSSTPCPSYCPLVQRLRAPTLRSVAQLLHRAVTPSAHRRSLSVYAQVASGSLCGHGVGVKK